jgi:hypothetical protein
MGRTTFKGYLRAKGRDVAGVRPAVLPMVLRVPITAVGAAGQATGYTLPKGAIPLRVDIRSGHTGGTSPLLDVGLGTDVDGLVDGAVATANLSIALGTATAGVGMGVELTVETAVTTGTGGGTAGTGASTAWIWYTMADNGADNS